VAQKLKMGIVDQMNNVIFGAGIIIINTNNVVPLIDEAFAKMRSEESSTAGDKNSFS
jgi:hypothetical protein